MRAVLILAVLLAWIGCFAGAVGCTLYLAATGVRLLARRRSTHGSDYPPASATRSPAQASLVIPLVVYAAVAAAIAAALVVTGIVLTPSGPYWGLLRVAALPTWAAAAAGGTAVMLARRS